MQQDEVIYRIYLIKPDGSLEELSVNQLKNGDWLAIPNL
jgi:hypothetical protein